MSKPIASRCIKRLVAGLLGISVAFVALMAFAHTKHGRPLLNYWPSAKAQAKGVRGGSGCPLGYGKSKSPEEREATRKRAVETLRGGPPALSRPALGFELDKTTKADVEAWAAKHAIQCRVPKVGPDLECFNVSSELLPENYRGLPLKNLWFQFGAHDRLVEVNSFRYSGDAQEISSALGNVVSTVTKEAGPPAKRTGDPSAEKLSEGVLRQAWVLFSFNNYRVETMATKIDYERYMLNEKYQSLNLL